VRNFIICTHPQASLGRSVKENEVGGACGTHGRGEESVQGFRGKETTRKTEDGFRMDFREIGFGGWSGFSWPRMGTGDGIL
jgi:hypothetical protein